MPTPRLTGVAPRFHRPAGAVPARRAARCTAGPRISAERPGRVVAGPSRRVSHRGPGAPEGTFAPVGGHGTARVGCRRQRVPAGEMGARWTRRDPRRLRSSSAVTAPGTARPPSSRPRTRRLDAACHWSCSPSRTGAARSRTGCPGWPGTRPRRCRPLSPSPSGGNGGRTTPTRRSPTQVVAVAGHDAAELAGLARSAGLLVLGGHGGPRPARVLARVDERRARPRLPLPVPSAARPRLTGQGAPGPASRRRRRPGRPAPCGPDPRGGRRRGSGASRRARGGARRAQLKRRPTTTPCGTAGGPRARRRG